MKISDFGLATVFGVFAVCFGFLFYLDKFGVSEENIRMAEAAVDNREKFKAENKSAFVLGATGEVGKELVKELLKSSAFQKVVLIGRREVKYEDELYKDVDQKIVDFDKIEEHSDAFEGLDVGFCCLGTTKGKAGAKGFYKVDHDYVMNSAKVALSKGCSQFHLVSSTGADKNSMFLYPKTKGEVEEELKGLGFNRLAIYRPSMLLCDRTESRPGEAAARFVIKPIAWAFPTAISIPTSSVAKAMINVAVNPSEEKWTLYNNKQIHELSGDLKKK